MLKTLLERGKVEEKNYTNFTSHSVSNCRYERLNLYQSNFEAKKKIDLCAVLFLL